MSSTMGYRNMGPKYHFSIYLRDKDQIEGHCNGVNSIDYMDEGNQQTIFTGGRDGVVCCWEREKDRAAE